MDTETAVSERPLLFSGPMVRSILEGRKTQTRRVFRVPAGMAWYDGPGGLGGEATGDLCDNPGPGWYHVSELSCPHGSPGDRLWVRETWAVSHKAPKCQVAYRADGRCFGIGGDGGGGFIHVFHGWLHDAAARGDQWGKTLGRSLYGPWRPSIHMPRWASRITLEIANVRIERLQAISREDVRAEGVPETFGEWGAMQFPGLEAHLWDNMRFDEQWPFCWDQINGQREGCRWSDNPWVWAITFRRWEANLP